MVLAQGLRLTAAGVGLGLVASALATRLVQSYLLNVSAMDAVAFMGAAGSCWWSRSSRRSSRRGARGPQIRSWFCEWSERPASFERDFPASGSLGHGATCRFRDHGKSRRRFPPGTINASNRPCNAVISLPAPEPRPARRLAAERRSRIHDEARARVARGDVTKKRQQTFFGLAEYLFVGRGGRITSRTRIKQAGQVTDDQVRIFGDHLLFAMPCGARVLLSNRDRQSLKTSVTSSASCLRLRRARIVDSAGQRRSIRTMTGTEFGGGPESAGWAATHQVSPANDSNAAQAR